MKDRLDSNDKKLEDLETNLNNVYKRIDYLSKKLIGGENKSHNVNNEIISNDNIFFQDDLQKIFNEIKNIKEAQQLNKEKISNNSDQIKSILEKIKNFSIPKNENIDKNMSNENLIKNEDLEKTEKNFDDLKSYLDNKLLEMNVKIELLLNSKENENPKSPKSRKNSSNSNNKSQENHFLNELFNKINSLEKSHKDLEKKFRDHQSSFNMSDIKDELSKLKDIKENISDLNEINKILKDLTSNYNKLLSDINNLNKKMEQLYNNFGDKDFFHKDDKKNIMDYTNIKEILDNYLTKNEYKKDIKQIKDEILKLIKEIDDIKNNINTIFDILNKKINVPELNDMKIFLLDKIEELAKLCNKKFADRIECLSNFKNLEDQLKKIILLIKTSKNNEDKAEKWLLAKKPISGYSCASCESYLGLLNDDVKKFIPWNRFPLHENEDKIYRMGSGYSKMLQMINFNKDGNLSISPDFFEGVENIELGNNNNNNDETKMGKTFYSLSKYNKKLKSKMRTQSANNEMIANGKLNFSEDVKNKNKKNVFPKVNSDLSDERFVKKVDENGMKSPKITKIVKKGPRIIEKK